MICLGQHTTTVIGIGATALLGYAVRKMILDDYAQIVITERLNKSMDHQKNSLERTIEISKILIGSDLREIDDVQKHIAAAKTRVADKTCRSLNETESNEIETWDLKLQQMDEKFIGILERQLRDYQAKITTETASLNQAESALQNWKKTVRIKR